MLPKHFSLKAAGTQDGYSANGFRDKDNNGEGVERKNNVAKRQTRNFLSLPTYERTWAVVLLDILSQGAREP